MKIAHVIGARPNFMKAAPVVRALLPLVVQRLIHTGQHYDRAMSEVFFTELGLPTPDVNLGVGSGSHAAQTAQVMLQFERSLIAERPDWIIVYGDVNSTLAAALVGSKLGIPVAHVEAGLRSYDRTMPEEVNRVLTDQVAELLFTSEEQGAPNLRREGVADAKIHFVGNVMIDTLVRLLPEAERRPLPLPLGHVPFVLVTLHRAGNVDHRDTLTEIVAALGQLAGDELEIVFPIHPRTRARLVDWQLLQELSCCRIAEPLGYLDFLALQMRAALVLTDSGGVQEETAYLGVPCLTLRPNTERPATIVYGRNRLIPGERQAIVAGVKRVLDDSIAAKPPSIPLWDGHAAERIAAVFARLAA